MAMAEVQYYPPPPALKKNPFPGSSLPIAGVTSGLLSSGMNYPHLTYNPPGWEGQPPPSPLQQWMGTPEGFFAKKRRGRGRGTGAGAGRGAARGRGRRGGGAGGGGFAGGCGDASGALPGQLDEFADEGVDEADELNAEAEEEGLGIGMPVRICNFFASGSDCYNGLIGDVVNVESVPEHAGEEEFLFTVRCLCSVPRRRSFSSVSNVPVSAMAQEAIEANRKQLRSSNHPNEAWSDDLPPMIILSRLPSEKLESLSY